MYCKIALVESGRKTRAVLLPVEFRDEEQLEQWSECLRKDDKLHLSSVSLSLHIGDWLYRQLLRYKRAGLTIAQHKAAVQAALGSIGINTLLHWHSITAQVAEHAISHHEDELIARSQVKQWLQGRKLLYDEWRGLVKDQLQSSDAAAAGNSRSAKQNWFNQEAAIHKAWRWLLLHGHVKLRCSVEWSNGRGGKPKLRCLRCYESELIRAERSCRYCGEQCYYCSSCLQMGKSRTCSALLIGEYDSPIIKHSNYAQLAPHQLLQMERFSLSDAQLMATNQALSFVYKRLSLYGDPYILRKEKPESGQISSQFLLWAVTGAGKTEMIFPLVAYMTALGGRVLLATPRRDVVLELAPRLRKAFPELTIVTLYGGSQERWQYGQLVLATTHQLMRYRKGFDLIIIDELDAFPYHGDERLYRVAAGARASHGITILLSATPPAYLQKEINRGRLAHIKLPVRYHRHPLPVPIRLKVPLVAEQLRNESIPASLIQAIKESLQAEAQIFIFLQRINHTEAYAGLLRRVFPYVNIAATSSQDAARGDKVIAFRQRNIRILVTTTILERGVTVPNSHVFICDAEAELFDEASLVQMAGRAGRSGDAPNGAVYFLSQQWSSEQKSAIKQIKSMNKLASQQGYLLPQYQTEHKGAGQ